MSEDALVAALLVSVAAATTWVDLSVVVDRAEELAALKKLTPQRLEEVRQRCNIRSQDLPEA